MKSNVRGTENVLWAAIKHEVGQVHPDLHRQGRGPDVGARRDQAPGGDARPGGARPDDHCGGCALRQRPRQSRVAASVLAEQMRNNLPITVTHPDMTRFFMTIEEAAGLVVEAAHLASDGEIFVLDMGEPVRILDIAQSFANAHAPPDVEVRFTGMRPGEKLNESLFSEHEHPLPTDHPRIFRTTSDQHSAGCTGSCAPVRPRRAQRRRCGSRASCAGCCRTTTRTRRWCPIQGGAPVPRRLLMARPRALGLAVRRQALVAGGRARPADVPEPRPPRGDGHRPRGCARERVGFSR